MAYFKQKIFFFFLFFAFFPFFVLSQELKYPQIPGITSPYLGMPFEDLMRYFYHLSLIGGVILAILIFIYGGLLYLFSLGNPLRLKMAKEKMIFGLFGLLILYSSYLILKTIDPQLVIFKKGLPPKVTLQQIVPEREIEKEYPSSCEEIGYENELGEWINIEDQIKDLISILAKKNKNVANLASILYIGSESIFGKMKKLTDLDQFTCEKTRTYCCAKCLTPVPISCTWAEGSPLPPFVEELIKKAQEILAEFAKKNIQELITLKEAKELQRTLNKMQDCNADYAKTLYIKAQAEKENLLQALNLEKQETFDFYCCSYY